MKTGIKIFIIAIVAIFAMCAKKEETKRDDILSGTASIVVDETLRPIIEDQLAVFESDYNAKIKLIARSEAQAIQAFVKDSAAIIILARELNNEEKKVLAQKQITPKITKFGTDAIALIINSRNNDTLISIDAIIKFMKGDRSNTNIKGLVFDDPNSSTVNYMNRLAGVSKIETEGIYSFDSNEAVIKFVSENQNMIGIVGLNWLSQPSDNIAKYRDNIRIMSVAAGNSTQYYYPSQNNLAEQKYPLARDLFIVDAQGYSGLGVGFASFIAGERGQRILLKSGLLPVRMPGRKIVTRTQIETNNNK